MKENEFPLITIVISAYNAEDTIADAVRSALNQDWPNVELIIADDGLQDNTANIVKSLIKGHHHARLIVYDKNKGFAGSLNYLISIAKGEFFAIFDDDDVSDSSRVTKQYKRIVEYEKKHQTDLMICHAARTQIYANGLTRYETTMGTDETVIAPHGEDVADRILFGKLTPNVVGSCANCSRMARTQVFKMMQGYDDSIRRGEDTDFNIRFAHKGGHFVGIAEPLVTQTMTMDSEKNLGREKSVEAAILQKNKDYLESKGWFWFCTKWLDVRYYNYRNEYSKLAFGLMYLAIRHPIRLFKKILWAIPANDTRKSFKSWHKGQLD